MSKLQNFLKGLIKENPVLVLVLGINMLSALVARRLMKQR